MAVRFTIHYDNLTGLARPHLRLWHAGASPVDLAPTGGDEFGPQWELSRVRPELTFTASPGAAQTDGHDRRVRPLVQADGGLDPGQVWCRGDRSAGGAARTTGASQVLSGLRGAPGLPRRRDMGKRRSAQRFLVVPWRSLDDGSTCRPADTHATETHRFPCGADLFFRRGGPGTVALAAPSWQG